MCFSKSRRFVKHLLSRITSYLDNLIGKDTTYVTYQEPDGRQFEIEHIWANKYDEHRDEFDQKVDFQNWRNSIDMLASLVKQFSVNGAVVAIDAPLVVANETGSRACDRNLMKEKIHGRNLSIFNCSRGYLQRTYGAIRGEEVVKSIQELTPEFIVTTTPKDNSHSIIEVFPTSIVLGLFSDAFPIKYKLKKGVEFSNTKNEMIRMLGLINHLVEYDPPVFNASDYFNPDWVLSFTTKPNYKSFEDKIDAFLCAYAAYWLSKNDGKIFGDNEGGFIVVPVEKTVRNFSGFQELQCSKPELLSNTQLQTKQRFSSEHTVNRSTDLALMLKATQQFHMQNGFEVGTKSQETMLYRMNLMMEELGEISQCLTKGKEILPRSMRTCSFCFWEIALRWI